jgi:hypothetical protein
VLHDMFAVPFDEIAHIVGRSPIAAKKLASRARRRIQGTSKIPTHDLARRRRGVEAFICATRAGDMKSHISVVDTEVVRRADRDALPPGIATEVRGARAVAEETRTNSQRARFAQLALVNGEPGIIVAKRGRLELVLRLTLHNEKIAEIDVIGDAARLRQVEIGVLD